MLYKFFSLATRDDQEFSELCFLVKKYDLIKNIVFQRNAFW